MPADAPTILATSGGLRPGERSRLAFSGLVHHAVERSGTTGRAPRVVHVGTAGGDQRWFAAELSEAARHAGFHLDHLALLPMPSHDDVRGLLLGADVVWVGGGSVAGLLALWRLHDLGPLMAEAWRAGVVLSGVSAGSLCWHVGGPTDSFGPDLRLVTDGLALLPYGNGVHYDSEAQRRPLVQRAVAAGDLPLTYCSDDGAGLLYRGTELVEVLTDRPGARGYRVERDTSGAAPRAVESPLEARLLPQP
ncbi:Type 1 glutamine amidotransferase-like domain-containing protein [Pseudokineococcus sp. 1T1Z-3]